MSYTKRIVKGSTIIFFMYFIGSATGYLLRLFMARNLTVSEFGLLYAVLSFVGFLTLFRDLGFGTTLTKFVAEFSAKNDFKSIKSSILIVISLEVLAGIIIASAVFVSADFISAYYFKTNVSIPLKIIAISFAVSAFIALQFIFQGLGKVFYISVVEPIRNILIIFFAIFLISLGVVGAAYSYLLGSIVLAVILFLMVLRVFPFLTVKAKITSNLVKSILLFSLPVFLTSISSTILGYTDTLVITYFLSLQEVGFYQVAFPTSQILWIIGGSVAVTVLYPIVTEIWTKRDTPTLSKIISLMVKFSFVLIIPLAILVAAFPDILIRLFWGESYLPASETLRVLTLVAPFYVVFSIATHSLVGIGKPEINVKIISFMAIADLILNIVLVPRFGIIGAAASTLLFYFLGCILSIHYLRKSVNFVLHTTDILKTLFAGTITFFVIILLKSYFEMNPWIELIIVSIIGAAVYFAALYSMNTIKKDEMRILKDAGIPIPRFLTE